MVANPQDRHAINLMLVSLSSVMDRWWAVCIHSRSSLVLSGRRRRARNHAATHCQSEREAQHCTSIRSALMCRVGRLSCCASDSLTRMTHGFGSVNDGAQQDNSNKNSTRDKLCT
jgi:hypothetical protein